MRTNLLWPGLHQPRSCYHKWLRNCCSCCLCIQQDKQQQTDSTAQTTQQQLNSSMRRNSGRSACVHTNMTKCVCTILTIINAVAHSAPAPAALNSNTCVYMHMRNTQPQVHTNYHNSNQWHHCWSASMPLQSFSWLLQPSCAANNNIPAPQTSATVKTTTTNPNNMPKHLSATVAATTVAFATASQPRKGSFTCMANAHTVLHTGGYAGQPSAPATSCGNALLWVSYCCLAI